MLLNILEVQSAVPHTAVAMFVAVHISIGRVLHASACTLSRLSAALSTPVHEPPQVPPSLHFLILPLLLLVFAAAAARQSFRWRCLLGATLVACLCC
jgi:hypothetical protein